MNAGLTPLTDAEASDCELIFRLTRKHLGFVPNSMRTMARQPAILSNFTMLVASVLGQPTDARLPFWTGLRLLIKNIVWTMRCLRSTNRLSLSLKDMVAHVASSASGCRYCQAHTIGEALVQGVSVAKLKAVWEFERSDLFDIAEKAALRFAFAAGSSPNSVTNEHFVELRKHYDEEQIVELGATIALMGFLNRWNDTFATTLESDAAQIAHECLGGTGWTAGKHA